MADNILDVIPASLAQDPEVFAAVKNLVLDAIEDAREMMDTASPAIKMQLIKSLLPVAARALALRDADDGMDELKNAVKEMHETVADHIGADTKTA